MLMLIVKLIGGRVLIFKKGEKDIVWKTDNKKTIINIIKIFEVYPPLTSRLTCQLEFLKKCLQNNDIHQYLLERGKKYTFQREIINYNTTKWQNSNYLPSYYPAWLSGFIEAKGCFSIRTKGPLSFSIGQINDLYLTKSIGNYFNTTIKAYTKPKDFYLIEIYKKSILLKIIDHCSINPLIGAKKESLKLFLLAMNKEKETN
jgi:hypothetical protein